ncbi:MAG: hypothetical protein HDS68_05245 [Bacteroidales bacterium]|nr:hypothetical protein [Bacteroidales bacterium]
MKIQVRRISTYLLTTVLVWMTTGIMSAQSKSTTDNGNTSSDKKSEEKVEADTDSIEYSIDLKEIAVEAQMSMAIEDGQAYIPKKRLKDASFNTFQLLSAMHLPLVRVDLVNGKISTNTDQAFTFYLNGLEASQVEIVNLRPKDILRVEVLKNPVNPQFHGDENVINIIAKEYQYGGFTTINLNEKFIINEGNGDVYSKLVKGKSTWQFTGGGGYANTNGTVYENGYVYNMRDEAGNPWTLERASRSEITRRRSGTYNAGVQWRLVPDSRFNVLINAGVFGSRMPDYKRDGSVTDIIAGDATVKNTTVDFSSSRVIPSLSVNMNYAASDKLYLSFRGKAVGSITNANDCRTEQSIMQSVQFINMTNEKGISPEGTLSAYYLLPNNTQLGLHLTDRATIFNTAYTGNTIAHHRFTTNTTSARLTYAMKLSKSWNLSLDASYFHSLTTQSNSDNMNEDMWNGKFTLSGRAGQKHSFTFSGEYKPTPPSPYMYTSVFTQNTSYTGTIGNADLKWQKYYSFMFNYSWFISNKARVALSTQYSGTADAIVNSYVPYNNIMYTVPVTSGNNDEFYAFLMGEYDLTSSLSLDLAVTARRFHQTGGIFGLNKWICMPSINLTYTPNNHFMVHASFTGPDGRASFYQGGYEDRKDWNLWLRGSYTDKSFNISLDILPLNKYFTTATHMATSVADVHSKVMDRAYGRSVSLSFSYNFEYGKKIDHSKSIEISNSASSTVR